MKSFICGFVAASALGLTGAAALNLTTQAQALVSPVLDGLRFHNVKPTDGKVGGDMEYHVTPDTLIYLRKNGKFILTGEGVLKPK